MSFLDPALWKQFTDADSHDAYLNAWLALQCRLIGGARRGVVVLGEPDEGPFAPAASWPSEGVPSAGLAAVAEAALAERRGVVQTPDGKQPDGGSQIALVAHPLLIEDQLYGVVAVEVKGSTASHLRGVMRHLRWGGSWIEVLLYRQRTKGEAHRQSGTSTALNLVAMILEEDRFKAACNRAVTELALDLGCEQVAIGFVRRGRCVVSALSHSAQFGRRMNLIRDIEAAMDEAIDQECMILHPPEPDAAFNVDRAHGALAASHEAGPILTVPMGMAADLYGAITFIRAPGSRFDQHELELCDSVAAVAGPVLKEKRDNDRLVIWKLLDAAAGQLKRLFGPNYLGRKLAVLVMAAIIAFFALAKGDYRVTSPAVLEGLVQRVIVAPFDGYVAEQNARAGDIVREGQVIATLDSKDLVLERLRWSTTRRQRSTEYSRALAKRDRAEINIIKAQIDQAEAQIELLDEQIRRTKLTSPFQAVIVSGDLSQSIGAAVRRGQELFAVAPLASYRVILEVDEGEISALEPGQTGTLLVASLPNDPLTYRIDKITPVSEAREGRNYFRVEAQLEEVKESLRPGMKGVAKTEIDRRLLIWNWTHKMLAWIRLTAWSFWP
ncbi:MAG: HlyD family efflux transporter periplasmic adaptor subunit [Pseudomonadota bacterium]